LELGTSVRYSQFTLIPEMYHVVVSFDQETGSIAYWHPIAISAKGKSEDTPNWRQAMTGPEKGRYWTAYEKESKGAWKLVIRHVLPWTRVYSWKRYPDGSVIKL